MTALARRVKPMHRTIVVALLTLPAILFASYAPAAAGTVTYAHTGNFRYMDPAVTTTINLKPGHPSHRVLIWSTTKAGTGYANNTVRMFNRQGKQVWSASRQKNRVYVVGSNITKITVARDCVCAGRNGVTPGHG